MPKQTPEHPDISPLKAANRPPEDALKFWSQRITMTPEEFAVVDDLAKSRAFTVAGIAKMDVLDALHESLFAALRDGKSIGEWRKEARTILGKKHKLPKHRLNNIIRTNLQTAYMAGRYRQMSASTDSHPYWRYIAIRDNRTRPDHASQHGKVYPADHEYWGTWYPPNGYQCRCGVQPISARQAERRGYKVEDKMPAEVPAFAANPGKDFFCGLAPTELKTPPKDVAMPTLCKKGGKGLFAADDDECWLPISKIDQRHIHKFSQADLLPEGLTDNEYAQAFLGEFGLKLGESKLLKLSKVKAPIVISDQLFWDKVNNRSKITKEGRAPYLKLLARAILDPFEIWQGFAQAGKRTIPKLTLIRLFTDEERRVGGFAAFRLYKGRYWTGSTVFPPKVEHPKDPEGEMLKYLEKERKKAVQSGGVLLHREE